MGIKSAMSTFLHCMFAPVSQMPLSSTWQHLSLISAVQIKRQRGKKQAAGLFNPDENGSMTMQGVQTGNSSKAGKKVTANLFQVADPLQ